MPRVHHDPRGVAFLASSELEALDPAARAILFFLCHRLDEAADAATRAYFAALLLDALRAVRPLAMGAKFGRRLEARLRDLAPPAPPPSPFSRKEAGTFISALDSAARDAYGSPSASAAREVVQAWVLRRRTK